MKQPPTRIVGLALIAIAIALGVAGVLLGNRPALYQATAMVKVQRDQFDLPELTGSPNRSAPAASANTSYFLETEIAVIQSEAIRDRVITNLDLNQAWGKRLFDGQRLKSSETSQLLKDRLQVQAGPDAALIIIKANSELATEAAEIANATAQAYREYRADYRRRLTQTALAAVTGKYAEMETQIAAAQQKVEQAGQHLDPALREQAAADSLKGESELLRKLHANLSESTLRYLAQSNQLALYQSRSSSGDEMVEQLKARVEKAKAELIAAEAAALEAARTQNLLKAYQAALFELEDLNQRFAPLKKTVEGLQNDLRAQGPAPALIVEQATPPIVPNASGTLSAASGKTLLLAGGGAALVLGVSLLLFGPKPRNPTV